MPFIADEKFMKNYSMTIRLPIMPRSRLRWLHDSTDVYQQTSYMIFLHLSILTSNSLLGSSPTSGYQLLPKVGS